VVPAVDYHRRRLRRRMDGRPAGDSGAARMHHSALGVWGLARAAEADIGAVDPMRPLCLRVVVESAEATLVLPVARTAIGIVTGTETETVMEVGLGRRGIDDRRCLEENPRLRDRRGMTGIVRRGTDGRCLVLGLSLVRVHHLRGGGGKFGAA